MAAGAGALQLTLGGNAVYHGVETDRPLLGIEGAPCDGYSIQAAIRLINRSLVIWLMAVALMTLL